MARNITDENYRTGGLFGENEVSGTGGGSVFATPGMPTSIFAGMNVTW